MSSIPINEHTSFSVAKSAKDLPLSSKKKKYGVILGVLLSGVGLAGFSAVQYSSSGGGGGNDGGGSIRASVNIDGSLSPFHKYADMCFSWGGSWNGKSFNGQGHTNFETCYRDYRTGSECWSSSYLKRTVDVGDKSKDIYSECRPQGYTGVDGDGWYWLNSGEASKTCGSECQLFDLVDVYF